MQIWDLKKAIVEGNIPHFLVFSGEERTLLYMYLNELHDRLKIERSDTDTLVDAFNKAASRSLLSSNKKLIVVKDDKSSLSDDKLLNSICKSSNYIVLILTNIDKRSQFAKQFDNNIVIFDKMSESILTQALMPQANIPDNFIKWLIEVCGRDYGRCMMELDKVRIFEPSMHKELFEKFARDGIIYCQIPDCIFDFSNAVMKRDIKRSYSLWEDLKLRGDSPIQILSILYNNFRNMLLVQLSPNPNKENTGLEDKQINGIKWNKGKYSDNELMETVLLIGELDTNIKQGIITEEVAMEYFLAKVM